MSTLGTWGRAAAAGAVRQQRRSVSSEHVFRAGRLLRERYGSAVQE